MSEQATGAVSGAEAQGARVAVAAAAADRNEPRWMLVLAAGGLMVSVVWLVLAVWLRSNAEQMVLVQKDMTADVQTAIALLNGAVADHESAMGGDGLKPNPLLASEIERIAKEAGVVGATISEAQDPRTGPAGVRRERYSMTNMPPTPLEDVLNWINRATGELAGLELTSLDLTPALATFDGKPRWSGTVAFTRWERKP